MTSPTSRIITKFTSAPADFLSCCIARISSIFSNGQAVPKPQVRRSDSIWSRKPSRARPCFSLIPAASTRPIATASPCVISTVSAEPRRSSALAFVALSLALEALSLAFAADFRPREVLEAAFASSSSARRSAAQCSIACAKVWPRFSFRRSPRSNGSTLTISIFTRTASVTRRKSSCP